jgi:hypothetical protein
MNSSNNNVLSPRELNLSCEVKELPDSHRLSSISTASKSSDTNYIRTTFYLPKNLHKRLKIKAAQDDRDMSGIVEELLAHWLD